MPAHRLLLIVDVAGLHELADVLLRVLLVARILAACHKASGSLVWQYKLVNLSVAASSFQAALHDACKASMSGKSHLPFSSEEHVRCNCTMFDSLRRWLVQIASSRFQTILERHLQKKGSQLSQPLAWVAVEKELCNVELDWFAKSPEGSTEIASVGLAPQSNIPASGANAIILVSDLPDMCAASQLSKGSATFDCSESALPAQEKWTKMRNMTACLESFQDTIIDGKAVTTPTKQRDVDMALSGLLGTGTVRSSEDAALPGATDDLCALTTELDACIAPQEMEKYQKLAEAARKKKRDKLVRQKHAKPPVKPIPDQHELEKAKAAVQKRERALKAAKTKEQKAQQDLRRKQLLEKKRALTSDPDADEVMSVHRPRPVQQSPFAEAPIAVDPALSAVQIVLEAQRAISDCLCGQVPDAPESAVALMAQVAEAVVLPAVTKLSRCSETQVAAAGTTAPAQPLCPSPSTFRLTSSPMDMIPASMSTIRRTLDGALLQANDAFCDEHPLNGKSQSHDRRVKLAMQIYLRLWLLIASKDDIPSQRIERPDGPPVIIAVGAFWQDLEDYWSDFVCEMPEIPFGGNEHYFNVMKPALVGKIPKAMQMIGRSCGVFTEDDLLIDLDADEVSIVGDSSSAHDGHVNGFMPLSRAASLQPSMSRGSSGGAQPAVSDNASGHSGSTLPCSKLEPQQSSLAAARLIDMVPKGFLRKRELTKGFAAAQPIIESNPKKAAASRAGPVKKKAQGKEAQTPEQNIRAADLLFSPCDTEDSEAIPGTERKAVRSSGRSTPHKASKRALAFCPIPAVDEMEAEENAAAQEDFPAGLSQNSSPAKDEAVRPLARNTWLQNAANNINLSRYPSKQMSRQMSLRPVTFEGAKSSMLDELMNGLSPCKPDPPPSSHPAPLQHTDPVIFARNSSMPRRPPAKRAFPAAVMPQSPCHVPASPEAKSSASQSSCASPSPQMLPQSPLVSPAGSTHSRLQHQATSHQQHNQAPVHSPSNCVQGGSHWSPLLLSPPRTRRPVSHMLSPPHARAQLQPHPSPLRKATGPLLSQAHLRPAPPQPLESPFKAGQSISSREQAAADAAAATTLPVATARHGRQAVVQPGLQSCESLHGQREEKLTLAGLAPTGQGYCSGLAPMALDPSEAARNTGLLAQQTEPEQSAAHVTVPTAMPQLMTSVPDVPKVADVAMMTVGIQQDALPNPVADMRVVVGQNQPAPDLHELSAQHPSVTAAAPIEAGKAGAFTQAAHTLATDLPQGQQTGDQPVIQAAAAEPHCPAARPAKSALNAASKQPGNKQAATSTAPSQPTAHDLPQPFNAAQTVPAATAGHVAQAAPAQQYIRVTRAAAQTPAAGRRPTSSAATTLAQQSSTDVGVTKASLPAPAVAVVAPSSDRKTRASAAHLPSVTAPSPHNSAIATAASCRMTRAATAEAQTAQAAATPASHRRRPADALVQAAIASAPRYPTRSASAMLSPVCAANGGIEASAAATGSMVRCQTRGAASMLSPDGAAGGPASGHRTRTVGAVAPLAHSPVGEVPVGTSGHQGTAVPTSQATSSHGPIIDHDVISLCDYIKKVDEKVSREELSVLKANLLVCFNNRKKHEFQVQLLGGPEHRSKKKLGDEWLKRKKELLNSRKRSLASDKDLDRKRRKLTCRKKTDADMPTQALASSTSSDQGVPLSPNLALAAAGATARMTNTDSAVVAARTAATTEALCATAGSLSAAAAAAEPVGTASWSAVPKLFEALSTGQAVADSTAADLAGATEQPFSGICNAVTASTTGATVLEEISLACLGTLSVQPASAAAEVLCRVEAVNPFSGVPATGSWSQHNASPEVGTVEEKEITAAPTEHVAATTASNQPEVPVPYNLAGLQGCLSVFEHLMQPNLQPAVPHCSADARQVLHQMHAYAQNSSSHSQHPHQMSSSVHPKRAEAMSTDGPDHVFGPAADASALPPVHAASLALSSPLPCTDSVLHSANAAHPVCGSQQQQSVNFSHPSAQHTLQHAAQLGSENISTGIMAPTLGDAPSGLAAASPAFSALLSAPSPSAMLLSPAPEFSPLAAIPELCVPSPPAPCVPYSLPSATALLDTTLSANTGQLLASTASLVSQVPAAQVMLQQPPATGTMQPHSEVPPNAAQPAWEQPAAAVMLSSGHPVTAAIPSQAAALQAALTSASEQIAVPSSSTSIDNPASAAASSQLERAGSFRQSHKRKPDKRKRTVAAATTAEPPAQRQKADQQRGGASVAPISQELQQAVAADDAQPVRRSSRPRKVTSAAKESAEQAEGYCQPRASSRSKAPKGHVPPADSGKPTKADEASKRSTRQRQQPASAGQRLSRSAGTTLTSAVAEKLQQVSDEEESDGSVLPVRRMPSAVQHQAATAARCHVDVETIEAVSTDVDIGDLLNQATPGKRTRRRKSQPVKGTPAGIA